MVSLNVEYLLTKIFGYFHIFTIRVKRLKTFCDFVGQEYHNILGHCNVRWLSMLPALERILQMYAPLKSFFLSEEKSPVVLRKFFEDPFTELWLAFVHGNLGIFNGAIKTLEGQNRCAVESAAILRSFQTKLTDDNFLPVMVRVPLRDLEENGIITKEIFPGKSKFFSDTAVKYLDAWGKHAGDLQDLSCLLKKQSQRLEIEKAVETLKKMPYITIDEDVLFDEVSGLQEFLQGGILEEWKREDTALIQRWGSVISQFQLNEIPHINIARLASVVISLPDSNAPVESFFP